MLVLTKKLINAYPNSFFSIMILGKRSIGKTSYALRSIHDFYVNQGQTHNNSWRLALNCLKFSIPDVISFLENALNKDIVEPVLLWDDTRVFGSGSMYRTNPLLVQQLGGLLDVIRTCLSNLILTCPSNSGLLGILKSYDDYICKIHYSPDGGYHRTARGYLWSSLPSGKRLIYHKYNDFYSCYLPQWVYDKYMKTRKDAMKSLLSDIRKTSAGPADKE